MKKDILSPLNDEIQKKRSADAAVPADFIRYFFVMPLTKAFDKKRELEIIGNCVSCLEFEHYAKLESIEMGMGHIILTVLLSPEEAPADFAYAFTDQCAHNAIPVKDRFIVSSVAKPDEKAIAEFLKKKK